MQTALMKPDTLQVDGEWVRWAVGLVILASLGIGGWFFRSVWNAAHGARVFASDGDRRLHERIDSMVKDVQKKVDELRDEAKDDRHEFARQVTSILSEDRQERDRFREKVFDELKGISAKLGEVSGMLKVGTKEAA